LVTAIHRHAVSNPSLILFGACRLIAAHTSHPVDAVPKRQAAYILAILRVLAAELLVTRYARAVKSHPIP
jgi:hypothetical protein